jgi:hypothetical protein
MGARVRGAAVSNLLLQHELLRLRAAAVCGCCVRLLCAAAV